MRTLCDIAKQLSHHPTTSSCLCRLQIPPLWKEVLGGEVLDGKTGSRLRAMLDLVLVKFLAQCRTCPAEDKLRKETDRWRDPAEVLALIESVSPAGTAIPSIEDPVWKVCFPDGLVARQHPSWDSAYLEPAAKLAYGEEVEICRVREEGDEGWAELETGGWVPAQLRQLACRGGVEESEICFVPPRGRVGGCRVTRDAVRNSTVKRGAAPSGVIPSGPQEGFPSGSSKLTGLVQVFSRFGRGTSRPLERRPPRSGSLRRLLPAVSFTHSPQGEGVRRNSQWTRPSFGDGPWVDCRPRFHQGSARESSRILELRHQVRINENLTPYRSRGYNVCGARGGSRAPLSVSGLAPRTSPLPAETERSSQSSQNKTSHQQFAERWDPLQNGTPGSRPHFHLATFS